jgi:hypothetical protein
MFMCCGRSRLTSPAICAQGLSSIGPHSAASLLCLLGRMDHAHFYFADLAVPALNSTLTWRNPTIDGLPSVRGQENFL